LLIYSAYLLKYLLYTVIQSICSMIVEMLSICSMIVEMLMCVACLNNLHFPVLSGCGVFQCECILCGSQGRHEVWTKYCFQTLWETTLHLDKKNHRQSGLFWHRVCKRCGSELLAMDSVCILTVVHADTGLAA